jgi:hypothetical protein
MEDVNGKNAVSSILLRVLRNPIKIVIFFLYSRKCDIDFIGCLHRDPNLDTAVACFYCRDIRSLITNSLVSTVAVAG